MSEEQVQELTPSNTSSSLTVLSITQVSADTIDLNYNTLSGNIPNNYGNLVAIWQNQNQIPWNQEPLQTQNIQGNSQAGSVTFTDLNLTNNSYIIGYSVGPMKSRKEGQEYGNICSTAFVPALATTADQDSSYKYFQANLSQLNVGTTSVSFQFKTPDGYQPATNLNWAGMWRGDSFSYTNPPDYTTAITLDASQGSGAFNNVNIGRGLTYTIAYFMGGWSGQGKPNKQTAIACAITFTNS